MSVDPEIFEVFREEVAERLDNMVETLLALEAGRAPADAIDSLFRDAHSIKGSAGMVGLDDARSIAHSMEDLLEDARVHRRRRVVVHEDRELDGHVVFRSQPAALARKPATSDGTS